MNTLSLSLIICTSIACIAQGSPSIEEWYRQGANLYQSDDLPGALECFKQVYVYAPDNSMVNHSLASTYRKLNELTHAKNHYEKALHADPTSGDSAFGLALTLLAQGDNSGWCYFNRWRTAQAVAKCPRNLQDVAGKTVVIIAEWGLGDMIHYIRYAFELKKAGARVVVQAHPALYHLLHSCTFIDELLKAPVVPAHADYYIPLLYLPTLCIIHNKEPDIPLPYLKAPDGLISTWQKCLTTDTRFKVGICWDIGHHDTTIPAWQRSCPLPCWQPLMALTNISFYSLQKNGTAAIKHASLANRIIDFGDSFDTTNGPFMDSAALMHHMDLIISVDTAIAHLAGAQGIKIWTLLPYSPDHRWQLTGKSTEHYPTMRLFRQCTPGNWDEVMHEIVHALRTELCL